MNIIEIFDEMILESIIEALFTFEAQSLSYVPYKNAYKSLRNVPFSGFSANNLLTFLETFSPV